MPKTKLQELISRIERQHGIYMGDGVNPGFTTTEVLEQLKRVIDLAPVEFPNQDSKQASSYKEFLDLRSKELKIEIRTMLNKTSTSCQAGFVRIALDLKIYNLLYCPPEPEWGVL